MEAAQKVAAIEEFEFRRVGDIYYGNAWTIGHKGSEEVGHSNLARKILNIVCQLLEPFENRSNRVRNGLEEGTGSRLIPD